MQIAHLTEQRGVHSLQCGLWSEESRGVGPTNCAKSKTRGPSRSTTRVNMPRDGPTNYTQMGHEMNLDD